MDNGTKFKADVLKLMKTHDVKVISVTTKYHHNFTAFVERFNKTLGERLFKDAGCAGAAKPDKRLENLGQVPSKGCDEVEQRKNANARDDSGKGGKAR